MRKEGTRRRTRRFDGLPFLRTEIGLFLAQEIATSAVDVLFSAAIGPCSRFEKSASALRAYSMMLRRNDGAPTQAAGFSARIASICRSACPMPAGITAQASLRAARSAIKASGVRWQPMGGAACY